MRNSRKNRMKKLLEQKLPYPHITVRADQQIDWMLSVLPDKEGVPKAEAPRKGPAHFKEEPTAQLVYFEEEPLLRRRLKTAAKCVLSLSALCFVCLFLFRWVLPNIAEAQRQPGRQESTLPIASNQPKLTPEPQPDEENAVTVDRFTVNGDDITLTMTLPVLPYSAESTMTCLPELRLRTDQGVPLELSSAHGITEYDADFGTPEEEGAESSTLEGEAAPSRQDGYLEMSPGDPYTTTDTFTGNLTGVKQVIVTAYNLSAESAKATAFPDGTFHAPIVLAEYTLDLETGEAKPSKTYEDLGLTHMSVSEYLEVFGADPVFQDHLWFGGCYEGYIGWTLAEGTNDSYRPMFVISCWADMADLPYEVNFYLYQDDDPYQSIPLYRTGEEIEVPNSNGILITRRDFFEKREYINTPDANLTLKDVIQRFYAIEIFLDEIYPAEFTKENPLDSINCYYEIVNIDTGEVVVDSRIASAFQKLKESSSSPAEGALASSNDVNLMSFQLDKDKGILSLELSYPAFSKTDLAAVEVHTMNASVSEGESLIGEEYPPILNPPADSGLKGNFLSEPPAGIRIGETFTETRLFEVPAGAQNLIVRVRNIPKDTTKDFEDGARISSFVFAEFCLDLRTGKALASDSYFAEWAEKGYSLNELMTVNKYAVSLQLTDRSYEGWFEEQYLGPAILSNYGIEQQAPNWMLQFYSDINLDLPMEAHFCIDGDWKLEVPLYRTENSVDVETPKHPDVLNYETRTEDSFLRVDPIHQSYGEDGSLVTRRMYTAIAVFNDEDYEADPYDLECGDYWNDHTIRVQVVTFNGDVIYDSNINGSGPSATTEPSPIPDPGQYDGS